MTVCFFVVSYFFSRCKVNGCEERFNDTSWLDYAIPNNTKTNRPDMCSRYATVNDTLQQCTPDEFLNKTVPCDSFVYEEGRSFVKEVSFIIDLL